MYIKLSRLLFYGLDNQEDKSILKLVKKKYKIIHVMCYLYINRNLQGISLFSVNDIITYCGVVPKHGKGKSIEQFKNILLQLHNTNIIKIESLPIDRADTLNKCKILIDLSSNYFELEENHLDMINKYVPLNENTETKEEKVDNTKLLLFYCYILARMYIRPKNDKDRVRTGGKTEVCYPSYDTINLDTGLSSSTINKYNQILIELDLIRIANAGQYYYKSDKKKKKDFYDSPNTYTLYNDQWKDNLEQAIQIYKQNSNLIFTEKRNREKSMNQLNGSINKLGSLIKKGIATQEHIDEHNRLVKKKEEMINKSIDSS